MNYLDAVWQVCLSLHPKRLLYLIDTLLAFSLIFCIKITLLVGYFRRIRR